MEKKPDLKDSNSIIPKPMTPKQTLEKIIEKAGNNGYHLRSSTNFEWIIEHYPPDEIFFDHSFAKAYFGEKDICISCNKESGQDFFEHERQAKCNADYEAWYTLPAWMEHIQRLALTPPEERLSYLAKHL